MWAWLLSLAALAVLNVESAGIGAARLVCYAKSARITDFSECTHLVYEGDARGDKLDSLLKEFRKKNPKIKIVLRVAETDNDLHTLLKSKHVQGLEINDAHKSFNKTKVLETAQAAKKAISSSGGGPLFLALPANPELLAKYYDLRALVKVVDLMMVQTHALGIVKKMTYHPSRLSGLWDMMNTDSVVDLVVGLGVPASKVVISLPATARQFNLLNETLSTPGSPTTEDKPKEIDQVELCRQLKMGRWTLERDQDLSAPYAFKGTTWISFEDSSSVDVKGKYARVRGLAGLGLHSADDDLETTCGPTLKSALSKVLNQQSRAPRAVVLRSLEHEILSAPSHARALDALQVSPYRITQVVDSDGVIHSIREDTRTEFSCSRQGYFVHPRSCARFYRCVKFDQLSPDFTVFEFDCPAGLAFDSRYEVCVWPGSLPHTQACPGSSEIAPVPQTRFICPEHEGYYVDPENCRWFFACLDHGKSPLTAYEFRCPFGLGFDAERLKCDWPWLVPACGNIARYEAEAFGYSAATLTGATGFQGQTADAINVAAHQSLVSGASLDNLVGIQSGFLTKGDTLDTNFIASQELDSGNGHTYQIGHGVNGQGGTGLVYNGAGALNSNIGLVQATKYNDENKYTSGALYLDDYRLPTAKIGHSSSIVGHSNAGGLGSGQIDQYSGQIYQSSGQNSHASQYNQGSNVHSSSFSNTGLNQHYQNANYEDNSGAYVHDPSGDYAEPYKHIDSPVAPYLHDDAGYKHTNDYYDIGKYSGQHEGKYAGGNVGQYVHENAGAYFETSSGVKADYAGAYNADYSGSYVEDNSGKYVAGIYNANVNAGNNKYHEAINSGEEISNVNIKQYHGSYSQSNNAQYLSNSKAYTGASHTLTAGAVNVGLVGKTTLVDAGYTDQYNYQGANQGNSHIQSHSHGVVHSQPTQLSYVAQPEVSINHVGTDVHNLDGYSYVTTPTSSVIPTTATPIAVTTSLPVAYKTTFVHEAPKSRIKQIFGYSQPAVTHVQPTVVAVKQQYVTPNVEITDHNSGVSVEQGLSQVSSGGYDYPKPATKFEDGLSYTTPAPVVSVSTYKPQGFSHSQQTLHKVESVGFEYSNPTPIAEEPFKKLVAYTTGPSVTTFAQPSVSTYTPQSYSHQTIHKVEANKVAVGTGYENTHIGVSYEHPQTLVEYTTAQPIVSTYQPLEYAHQTLHQVDQSKVNTFSKNIETGYEYAKPSLKFIEEHKPVIVSTPAPSFVSTYKPQTYSHQTIHHTNTHEKILPVSSTALPKVELTYQQPAVSIYSNPILKYTQKVTPISHIQPTAAVYTQTYKPIVQQQHSQVISQPVHYETSKQQFYNTQNLELAQGYSYSQPEIQRDVETLNEAKSYSDASVVSHQVFHQSNGKSVQNSGNDAVFVSTTPSTLAYEDHYSEYESPKIVQSYKAPEYIPPKLDQQSYSVVSTASAPLVHQSYITHENQNNYGYNLKQTSEHYQTVHNAVPHQQVSFSTSHVETPKRVESIHFSSLPGPTITTKQNPVAYQVPEVQVAYKAEEYLPPVVSTAVPTVTSIYKPQTYSTVSTTREYLPPSPEPKYNGPEYLPPKEVNVYLPPPTTAKPITSTYKFIESTTAYKAPEYLPPLETEPKVVNFESFGLKSIDGTLSSNLKYNPYQDYKHASVEVSTAAPIQRKQNIVVQTAKSHLLGFGTVGPDAGLVSPVTYSTATPIVVSSPESYTVAPKIVTSTYAPIKQQLVEVTPSIPVYRPKPKVAVVTKINDFNPLLVRKLGAVCSCQSPVLVLRGTRPNVQTRDYEDYSDVNAGRGDISDNQWTQKLARIQAPVATSAPVVKSTFNPIIVPDDSFYQDYQDSGNVVITPKSNEVYSENFVSSTLAPVVYSTTEKIVRIRPRIKAVTVAPTYKTVLLNEAVTSEAAANSAASIASKSFDRYGPGGLRSRDETLQGSVDCQRAGLFRHPKQCNKFYACRWDCTKQRFTLHVFNCPIQLSFDPSIGACNWPSQGPACQGDTLLTNTL